MTRICIRGRAGHMNQVRINQNQISLGCDERAVVEEEKSFSLQNIKDFILWMKMFDAHIKMSGTDHMLKRDSIYRSVVSNLFQGSSFRSEHQAVFVFL